MYFRRGSFLKFGSPMNAWARSTESVGHIQVPFLLKRAKRAAACFASKLSSARDCSSVIVSTRKPSARIGSFGSADELRHVPCKDRVLSLCLIGNREVGVAGQHAVDL